MEREFVGVTFKRKCLPNCRRSHKRRSAGPQYRLGLQFVGCDCQTPQMHDLVLSANTVAAGPPDAVTRSADKHSDRTRGRRPI